MWDLAPNDMLASKSVNYSVATTDPLASYWDSALLSFFSVGKYLSINLNAGATTKIYSGQCSKQTNPDTGVESPAYVLKGINGTFTFYMPLDRGNMKPGLRGAQYVFQQSYGVNLTPAGPADDEGLLQDDIWEAFCRGVALDGVSETPITNGESTTAWNHFADWYKAGSICHYYAKFLHYSTIDGTDSRTSGTPILYNNAAYGFSLDEDPNGPYSGPNVPSKTPQNVPDGSTLKVNVGPWDTAAE